MTDIPEAVLNSVARALHDEWHGVGGWSSLTDVELRRWRFMARLAIETFQTEMETWEDDGSLRAAHAAYAAEVEARKAKP